jgi:hypothetical protein
LLKPPRVQTAAKVDQIILRRPFHFSVIGTESVKKSVINGNDAVRALQNAAIPQTHGFVVTRPSGAELPVLPDKHRLRYADGNLFQFYSPLQKLIV